MHADWIIAAALSLTSPLDSSSSLADMLVQYSRQNDFEAIPGPSSSGRMALSVTGLTPLGKSMIHSAPIAKLLTISTNCGFEVECGGI